MFVQRPLAKSDVCQCSAGLAVFAWLQFTLYKANQTLRRQVALKTEYNKRTCISLGTALVLHVPAVRLCLSSDHLWDRFLLLPPTEATPVRSFWMHPDLLHWICCAHQSSHLQQFLQQRTTLDMRMQFWTALFWVTTVDLLASYQGIVIKVTGHEFYLSC